MATISYPAVGEGGLTDDQWSKMHASQDGIVEDYMLTGVEACAMTRSNATDKVTIKPGKVKINGYILDIITDSELDAPAPGAGTAVYSIAGMYDPALNVADGEGAASEQGPCRLIITNGPLDMSGGKQYTLLRTLTRSTGQDLTAAPTVDYRRWIGVAVSLPVKPATDPGDGWDFPRGSTIYETSTGFTYLRDLNDVTPTPTGLMWRNLTQPPELPFPGVGGLVAYDVAPTIVRANGRVSLAGTLKRSNGANLATGAAVTLATLPAGFRPAARRVFVCGAAGTLNFVLVAVYPTGLVQMVDPVGEPTINGIWLDGIDFKPTQ